MLLWSTSNIGAGVETIRKDRLVDRRSATRNDRSAFYPDCVPFTGAICGLLGPVRPPFGTRPGPLRAQSISPAGGGGAAHAGRAPGTCLHGTAGAPPPARHLVRHLEQLLARVPVDPRGAARLAPAAHHPPRHTTTLTRTAPFSGVAFRCLTAPRRALAARCPAPPAVALLFGVPHLLLWSRLRFLPPSAVTPPSTPSA